MYDQSQVKSRLISVGHQCPQILAVGHGYCVRLTQAVGALIPSTFVRRPVSHRVPSRRPGAAGGPTRHNSFGAFRIGRIVFSDQRCAHAMGICDGLPPAFYEYLNAI